MVFLFIIYNLYYIAEPANIAICNIPEKKISEDSQGIPLL